METTSLYLGLLIHFAGIIIKLWSCSGEPSTKALENEKTFFYQKYVPGSVSRKWFLESNKVPEWFQIHFAYLPNLSLFACWKKHFGKQFSRNNDSWFAWGLLEVNFNVLHWHDAIVLGTESVLIR